MNHSALLCSFLLYLALSLHQVQFLLLCDMMKLLSRQGHPLMSWGKKHKNTVQLRWQGKRFSR